jgi:hypothetical protein
MLLMVCNRISEEWRQLANKILRQAAALSSTYLVLCKGKQNLSRAAGQVLWMRDSKKLGEESTNVAQKQLIRWTQEFGSRHHGAFERIVRVVGHKEPR